MFLDRFEEPPSDESELPLRYDALCINRYWDRRPREVIVRTFQILAQLVPFLSKVVLWEMLVRRKILKHEGLQRKYSAKLRNVLTDLGPCFIKLGQALSIRPDLLPSPVLFELQKLCDAVESFPTDVAFEVMRKEFAQDPKEIFADLDSSTRPVAAASLGQVYKLHLREGGASVAVKVQRPDMLSSILLDLYIIRRLAQCSQFVKTLLTKQRPYDVSLIDTFASASLLELDYLNEASNQEFFREKLVAKMRGQVYVPSVYSKLTTRKVLVTEWIEGEKLATSSADVINRLTPVGVECFLMQLLEIGFFHADPHPGNLLVTPDGRLALIDFGLCAEVPLPDTTTMTLAVVHLMQGDVRGMVQDAIELGFLPRDIDADKIYHELDGIIASAREAMTDEVRLRAVESSKYKAVTTRRKRFMAVSFDLNRIFFEYPFLVPNYFALITRAMIVLEGIAVTGNPEFDIFSSAYPYAVRRAVALFGLSNVAEIVREAFIAQKSS